MAKSDVLVRMKADTQNYDANIAKARKTLQAFKQDNLTLGGIMKQSSTAIVSAAAQYASFAAVLGTVATGFATVISEGTAMAREMEGVKIAFDRLNNLGLLDNLREATHNTVNDLELMKAAVKFDDFRLPVEELGTMLAFAQKKAKETGQSVDYMVDSIVTGLGRQSLMILDNLGLSAAEIKEKMKETGDMTKAVGEIIREQMSKAGDYIETASDRAAQAQVRLDNAMMELGNTFSSLTTEASGLWTELKIGAINVLNTAIKPLIAALNSLAGYINVPSAEDILKKGMTDVTSTVTDSGRLIPKDAINSIPDVVVTGTKPKKTKASGRTKTTTTPDFAGDWNKAFRRSLSMSSEFKSDEIEGPSKAFEAVTQQMAKDFEQPLSPLQKLNEDLERLRENLENAPDTATYQLGLQAIAEKEEEINKFKGIKKDGKEAAKSFNQAAQAISAVGSAMASIEDPAAKIIGTIGDAIASVALGYAQATVQAAAMGPWTWVAFAATGLATMISTIEAIHSATGYAQGGVIPGSSFSGDQQWARVNAGETILTQSQAGILASRLQSNGLGNLQLSAVIRGETLRLVLNNNGRRTGRGEYVQTNFR